VDNNQDIGSPSKGAPAPGNAAMDEHPKTDHGAHNVPSGIRLKEVRVRNFRCLRCVDVELESLTVLVGQNNAGKTSFLDALHAAIGIGQRTISSDDIFINKSELAAPKDRLVVIDILVRPVDDADADADVFPVGSPWLELWGSGIVQDDRDRDLVGIRTTFKWNTAKGEYVIERRFLKDWQVDSSKWEDSKFVEKIPSVSSQQLEPIGLYLLDSKRDISDDLRTRSSFWSKMVDEHGLSTKDVERIEQQLSEINKDIVGSSEIFTHLESHLKEFHETLSCDEESIAITPIARHLRDLARGTDVVLSTRGAPPFPLNQQGMGTRSLGTFFTFWAFTTWRQKRAGTDAIHPVTAIEEPETHLHPQAQRALFRQIKNMPGQRIVSTHSPYICGQGRITDIRHLSKQGEETKVCRIKTGEGGLSEEDLRKIDRQVMNTRGDILFATALVFFEGETEEQALPDFAEKFWGTHPNDLGYSFVGVGGCSNYLPFLRMAANFQIPWFIFSDGEAEAIAAVNTALASLGEKLIPDNPMVIVMPDGKDFEQYLVTKTSLPLLVEAIIKEEAENPEQAEAQKTGLRTKSEGEQLSWATAKLKKHKTKSAASIGKLLPVPAALEELFKKIDNLASPAKPAAKT
jgi:putative ATP-dependent endonuclease of OLD family